MKMDHHCPWINNCVGHFNHGHFVGFLASAVLGCAQASFVLSMTLYYGLNRSWYHYYGTGAEPKVTLTLTTLLVVMFALGLAIGVVLAVGALPSEYWPPCRSMTIVGFRFVSSVQLFSE